MPSPEYILSIDQEDVAGFIQEHASAKTLSPMVKKLNDVLLSEDEGARYLAAKALQHLGFSEYA